MSFATIAIAQTQAGVLAAAGTILEGYGCYDQTGTPAIYCKHPIGTAGYYDTGGLGVQYPVKSGSWGWLEA
jgi:hypothetical protein